MQLGLTFCTFKPVHGQTAASAELAREADSMRGIRFAEEPTDRDLYGHVTTPSGAGRPGAPNARNGSGPLAVFEPEGYEEVWEVAITRAGRRRRCGGARRRASTVTVQRLLRQLIDREASTTNTRSPFRRE